MGNTSGAKYKHMLYNVSWVRRKSWDKLKNAIEWFINILKKEVVQWETKWIYKTKKHATERLKKFGVTKDMLIKNIEKKWLKDLLSKIK